MFRLAQAHPAQRAIEGQASPAGASLPVAGAGARSVKHEVKLRLRAHLCRWRAQEREASSTRSSFTCMRIFNAHQRIAFVDKRHGDVARISDELAQEMDISFP